ncbi:MAG: hypothetical protein ACHQPH_06300, partial [Reyranellales bacterium]
MQRKSITAPIVSATRLRQLEDLIAAPDVKLDAESVAAIDKASAPLSLDRATPVARLRLQHPMTRHWSDAPPAKETLRSC